MKKSFASLSIIIALSLHSINLVAQDSKQEVPKWVSDKGYWVVENNIHDPLHHIVRFYDNDDVMIYKETITGVKLNTDKVRIKMKLKKALEDLLITWQKSKVVTEEKQYVSAILK